MVDMSMLAPNGPQGEGMGGLAPKGAAAGGAMGPKPGQLEAFKAAIQSLQQMGLELEEIIKAALAIAENMGIEMDPQQLQQLIEQEAGSGEVMPEKGAMAGATPMPGMMGA